MGGASSAADDCRFSFRGRRQRLDSWGDSGTVVASPLTDTSTDVEIDDRNRNVHFSLSGSILWSHCNDQLHDCSMSCNMCLNCLDHGFSWEVGSMGPWSRVIVQLCHKRKQGITRYICHFILTVICDLVAFSVRFSFSFF